jgi:hypothetical protein
MTLGANFLFLVDGSMDELSKGTKKQELVSGHNGDGECQCKCTNKNTGAQRGLEDVTEGQSRESRSRTGGGERRQEEKGPRGGTIGR